MCDYSLHAHQTRLAEEGEQLVVNRFPGGSIGLACPAELRRKTEEDPGRKLGLLETIRAWFAGLHAPETPIHAVCIPPGARLMVRDIPAKLRNDLSVEETELVTFVQTSAQAYTYRDGIRFANGKQVLLQALREGQRVDVLSLSCSEAVIEIESSLEDLIHADRG